jgi:hypothetical protein
LINSTTTYQADDARARAASAWPGGLPLGTIARFPSTASQCVSDSGASRQIHRFALQSAARELLPRERVAVCLRRPIPYRPSIDVLYSPASRSAHFGGLQVCGSVWLCPVCSAKITERRRVELSAGLESWSGRAVLVTFTLQHKLADSLADLRSVLLKSYESLRSGRWWPAFEERHGLVGSVRALEVTYGSSGWHPHLHVLMFLKDEVKIIPFEGDLKGRWGYVLGRSERYASWDYGVDVRFSDADVAAYVVKFGRESEWTIAHEMAKSPVKKGRSGGRSPLQLLSDSLLGDEQASRLWIQYAVNFKGLKQLVWSRGLRRILGLVGDEKTDEEIAVEQTEVAILLAQLTRDQWRVVLGNDARGELLNVAASGSCDEVVRFLRGLGIDEVSAN